MTDPIVRIDPVRLVVEPGGQARAQITVRNTDSIVEGYRLKVLGDAADWSEVLVPADARAEQADVMNVFRGGEATAVLVVSVPPGTAAGYGEVPVGVLATSVVAGSSASAAAECVVEIGRVHGLAGSLRPVTSTGRWSGRHAVTVKNAGNAPVTLDLTATDPDAQLGFLVHPPRLDIPVGGSATAAVRVRTRHPFLRGAPVRLPFTVTAEPYPPDVEPPTAPAVANPRRPVMDAAFTQKPVLSRGTVVLASVVAVALVGVAVTAFRYKPEPAPELPVTGALPAPTAFAAQAVDHDTIRLTWTPVTRTPEQYQLLEVDPAARDQNPPIVVDEQPVPGSLSVFDAEDLTPTTEHCFTLRAVAAGSRSPDSATACARTAAAPLPPIPTTTEAAPSTTAGSPTTQPTATTDGGTPPSTGGAGQPGGGSGTATADTTGPRPDEFLVLVGIFPRTQAPALKEQRRAQLQQQGHDVQELDSTDYPELPFTNPTDVLYVGGFDTEQAARQECESRVELQVALARCLVEQPGPRR